MELATAPAGSPVEISVQVRPPSLVRKKCGLASSMRIVFAAAYAVRVLKCPASILKMRVHGLIAAGVTLVQCRPPSTVTWMLPSSVPAQSVSALLGEGESAVIVPRGPGVTLAAYCPALAGTSHVWRARSGLMRVHVCAWSVDFQTAFDV